MVDRKGYDIIVIGGGHAGAEAAWAAANLEARVAMITMDPAKIGAMSCNPAIGGLAKGQMVREIDALGGLMGLAADATGIQFRVLNRSKGPAVHGPRCQSDKYRYAREVQRLLRTRRTLDILAGTVERILVERGKVKAVVANLKSASPNQVLINGDETIISKSGCDSTHSLIIPTSAVVLTTGTFMRGLMHTGPCQVEGGRIGEGSAVGISAALLELGFELGRLKTGTPPRLQAQSIDFDRLDLQPGDSEPAPFSDMTLAAQSPGLELSSLDDNPAYAHVARCFPVLEQRPCHITFTNQLIHEAIRANLHRAPMYNGQIATTGPRYCPSIEDKVVRFADRQSHHVYLEPESLETDEIYCNGISTSLPADIQEFIVRHMPGCEHARILRPGYAVEYDMVWPHQIDATGMTKRVEGLFLAGQINGTSGYEEAAGQGLLAGLNAVRFLRGQELIRLRRDQAYLGVMMDDLVTKTPREPYRMFTSRAEYRLLLRADNADDRLTPLGRELGLVDDARWRVFQARQSAERALERYLAARRHQGQAALDWLRQPNVEIQDVLALLNGDPLPELARSKQVVGKLLARMKYAGFLDRQQQQIERLAQQEQTPLPNGCDFQHITGLRREAQLALDKFRPATLGQAARLAGVTPADIMVISIALRR